MEYIKSQRQLPRLRPSHSGAIKHNGPAVSHGVNDTRANEIVDNTRAIVLTWKERARKLGIAAGDIELTGSAFSALDDGGGGRR